MRTVAIIQARMGSSRLPGKVMLPLDGKHLLEHVVERVSAASEVDEVVVATSTEKSDDIIPGYAAGAGASVIRGSESDVLSRMYEAAVSHDAEAVVRVTADCPLVPPGYLDVIVRRLDEGYDYVTNGIEKTFPTGITAEAFTFESFEEVRDRSEEPHEREHVTPYYYENPSEFDLYNVTSDEVYEEPRLHDRTDLRLTLDEADDYELIRKVYEGVSYTGLLDLADAVEYIDERGLDSINAHVQQKSVR